MLCEVSVNGQRVWGTSKQSTGLLNAHEMLLGIRLITCILAVFVVASVHIAGSAFGMGGLGLD